MGRFREPAVQSAAFRFAPQVAHPRYYDIQLGHILIESRSVCGLECTHAAAGGGDVFAVPQREGLAVPESLQRPENHILEIHRVRIRIQILMESERGVGCFLYHFGIFLKGQSVGKAVGIYGKLNGIGLGGNGCGGDAVAHIAYNDGKGTVFGIPGQTEIPGNRRRAGTGDFYIIYHISRVAAVEFLSFQFGRCHRIQFFRNHPGPPGIVVRRFTADFADFVKADAGSAFKGIVTRQLHPVFVADIHIHLHVSGAGKGSGIRELSGFSADNSPVMGTVFSPTLPGKVSAGDGFPRFHESDVKTDLFPHAVSQGVLFGGTDEVSLRREIVGKQRRSVPAASGSGKPGFRFRRRIGIFCP